VVSVMPVVVTPLTKWLALQAVISSFREEPAPSAVVVAAKLLDCHNGKTGRCDPSYGKLALWTGLNRRTIMDAVALLERKGWYRVKRTSHEEAKGVGGLPSNDFYFNWDRAAAANSIPPSEKNSTTPSEKNSTNLGKKQQG
jgi:Helix-turn-helix domain